MCVLHWIEGNENLFDIAFRRRKQKIVKLFSYPPSLFKKSSKNGKWTPGIQYKG